LDEWRDILMLAARFAANCHAAYRAASSTAKRQLNRALFTHITVRDGHIDAWQFDALFNPTQFEYGSYVDQPGRYSNLTGQFDLVRTIIAAADP
jgi:hypothetical protein